MKIPASFKEPRTIAVVCAAVILTWLVVSGSFAAYFADSAPETALWLDPHNPQALLNLSEQELASPVAPRYADSNDSATPGQDQGTSGQPDSNGGLKPKDSFDRVFSKFVTLDNNQSYSRQIAPNDEPAIREQATEALVHDPLNARALRILGQLADADGQDQDTLKFMTAATQLSRHEDIAGFWLMINSFRTHDLKTAVYYADVLMRASVRNYDYVIPVLARD